MTTDELRPPVLREEPGHVAGGLVEWVTTVDHKKIGILYIFTSVGIFLIAGILALIVRVELAQPGLQAVDKDTYNHLFTMHGTMMIFLFAAQISTGLANYFVPIQIGAADVVFPRLNAMSYWLYLFGSLMVLSGFLTAGGAAKAGWTAYPPLSDSSFLQGRGMDLWIVGIAIVGAAAIAGAVNFLTTPIDFAVNDTYYVVAHFHYVMAMALLFALLAGTYFWFPKMTGRFLDERLGKIGFWLLFIAVNLTFFPMSILGLRGMPRRIADYQPDLDWNGLNLLATIGAFLVAASMLPLAWNVVRSLRGPRVAGDDPWEGNSLEWVTTSPPPHHNFHQIPQIISERPAFDLRHSRKHTGLDSAPSEQV